MMTGASDGLSSGSTTGVGTALGMIVGVSVERVVMAGDGDGEAVGCGVTDGCDVAVAMSVDVPGVAAGRVGAGGNVTTNDIVTEGSDWASMASRTKGYISALPMIMMTRPIQMSRLEIQRETVLDIVTLGSDYNKSDDKYQISNLRCSQSL
jgi:hypothetical protein